MYELFDRAASRRQLFLIRLVQNRMTMENKRILDEIRKEKCRDRSKVIIPRDSEAES